MVLIVVEARSWLDQVLLRESWKLRRTILLEEVVWSLTVEYVQELLEVGRSLFDF